MVGVPGLGERGEEGVGAVGEVRVWEEMGAGEGRVVDERADMARTLGPG